MDGQGQTLQNDLNGNHGHHPNGESSISQDGNDWHDHSGGRVKGKRQGGNYGGDGDRNRQGAESQNWRSEGNRSQQGHRDNWQDGRGQGKRGKRGRGGNRDRDDHHQGDRRQGQEHHQERRGQEQRQERRGQEEHQDRFQERRGKPRHNKDPALEKIQREQDHRGYVFFYQGGSPFSQWHPAFFEVDHVQYNCTEQFMMHQKAVLMGDHDSAEYILSLYEPRKQKEAGRNVYPWKQDLWDRHCYDIVKKGNYAKFSQNEELRDALLETHPKTLVETNPFDKIWGIGLTMDDPNAKFQASWKGRNYLGFILTEVRDQLMSEGYKVQGKSSKRIPGMPEPAKHEKKAAIPGGQGPPTALPPTNGKDWFDEESTSSTPAHGVSDVPSPIPKMTKCFISIITTSSDKDSSLLQLSVLSPAGRQNWYVKPSKPVSKQVEEVTGIKYDKGGQMYVSERKVEALPPKQVLQGLLDFLEKEPAYLVGHNIKSYSCYVVIEAATPAGLNERMERHLTHMVDLVTLARHHNRELKAQLTLEELSETIIGRDIIRNDAAEDVTALKKIFEELNPSEETMKECMFDYKYVMNAKRMNEEKSKNLESWKPIISKGAIPKKLAEKAARNGVNAEDLLKAYKEGGEEKLGLVMSEKDDKNQPKVSDKKENIHQLSCYFKKNMKG